VGAPPWNKLHEGVRWLVQEIRALCPERDFGTRTIARHIMRSGIQISRASVRRILEEQAPRSARVAIGPRIRKPKTAPDHLLRPRRAHHVWHVDLTTVRILWMRFEIAAIIDGYAVWHNCYRPHAALGTLTPSEEAAGMCTRCQLDTRKEANSNPVSRSNDSKLAVILDCCT
ncbi:MAG: hypothetical protein AB8F26_10335, partial [Phycisphaerales bacterium]